jgi:DNA polymerase III sliding clamp (beta) subunit (PCNA family)
MRVMLVKGTAESAVESEFLLPAHTFQILASVSDDEDVFDVGTVGRETVFMKKNMLFSLRHLKNSYIDTNALIKSVVPKYSAVANANQIYNAIDFVSTGTENAPLNLLFAENAAKFTCKGEKTLPVRRHLRS